MSLEQLYDACRGGDIERICNELKVITNYDPLRLLSCDNIPPEIINMLADRLSLHQAIDMATINPYFGLPIIEAQLKNGIEIEEEHIIRIITHGYCYFMMTFVKAGVQVKPEHIMHAIVNKNNTPNNHVMLELLVTEYRNTHPDRSVTKTFCKNLLWVHDQLCPHKHYLKRIWNGIVNLYNKIFKPKRIIFYSN